MTMLILLHVIFSTVFALIIGCLNGAMSIGVAQISLGLGTIAAYVFSKNFKFSNKKDNSNLDLIFLVMVLGLVVYHAAFLYFYKDHGWWTLNPHNYGDLPWHISVIRYIGQGGLIWPMNPIFANELIRYPFAIDLYNALWEQLGFEMSQHLALTLILLLGSTAYWIYRWLGWVGLAGIFFSGGWFGWSYLNGHPIDIWLKGVEWKNGILALWVPQRSLLIGLPLGLLMIKEALEQEKIFKGLRGTLLQIFLWGVFPFFHAHAFVATVIVVLSLSIVHGRLRRQLLPLLFAAPLGTWFVYMLTDGFSRSSVARVSAGWMLNGSNPMNFWWWNLGPWALAWLGLLGISLTERFKKYWALTFLSLVLFVFFNFVILAPWEWDNIKVLIWPYFLFVIVLATFVKEHVRTNNISNLIFEVSLAFVLAFSGIILNFNMNQTQSTKLFEANELYELRSCLKSVPREAVFASQPTFNHPVGALGYKLVLGYPGHIWSHGINYQETENKLNNIMRGQDNWKEDLISLHISHIFWGAREQETFGSGDRPWMKEFEKISCRSLESKEVSVYVVK